MKKTQKYFIISCFIAIIFGTLQHFAYDITNNNILVGLISPVNESVWEHLKLVFLPITIFAIITKIKYDKKNTMISAAFSIIISSILISIIHYAFKAINIEVMAIDIIAYIISMILAFYIMYIFYNNKLLIQYEAIGYILLLVVLIIFALFTIYPPRFELFLDTTLNLYGIP